MAVVQSWAGHVTEDQARQKASKFLNGRVAARTRSSAPAADELKMAEAGPDDSYFIFNVGDGEGFVIVSGEDATEEVLGFSDTGSIHPESMPCNMRMLFDNYAAQIKHLRDKGITREEIERSSTRTLEDDLPEAYTIDESRRSRFDQLEPYNNDCPLDRLSGFNHSVTGCVATAMAGLMYAYKWPKATTKKIPSYIDKYVHIVNSSPKNTAIDWDNIIPQYGYRAVVDDKVVYTPYNNISEEKQNAIALLMRLAGSSVKTNYSYDGSGANVDESVPNALKEYFGYRQGIIAVYRENYDAATWRTQLKKQIFVNGPVIFRGTGEYTEDGKTTQVDHAFLLEGWEGDAFHINFGWSGYANDGTYLLEVAKGNYNFANDQCAIVQVKAKEEDNIEVVNLVLTNKGANADIFTGEFLSGFITLRNLSTTNSTNTITLTLTDQQTGETKSLDLNRPLYPNEVYHPGFKFKGLTLGHSYVLAANYSTGIKFYSHNVLTCQAEPEYDPEIVEAGNEDLDQYEYWFDDNFADRKTIDMSGNKSVINTYIGTEGLDDGAHRLNFRLRRSSGEYHYSAINTIKFLKQTRGSEGKLYYWLDDDYENRMSVDIEETEEDQDLTLDLSDASPGYHRLHLQATTPGTVAGNVVTKGVMKLASGISNRLEYWFDSDIAHSVKLEGKSALAEKGYVYNQDIDLSSLSPGFHRVNVRATSENGITKGSIMSYNVMKLPKGKATKLECWFDSDRKNLQTLTGNLSGNEYVYNTDLNLEGLEPGHHRLYYRTISEGGAVNGSVCMAPVVIKSKYGEQDTDAPVVTGYSIEVDDQEQDLLSVFSPQAEVVIPHTVDARQLSAGNHTLTFRAWNSAQAAVSVEQPFKVTEVSTPTLTLNAQESGGLVSLRFEPVPNDLRYRIIRVDDNGVKAKVDSKEGSSYPGTVAFTDNPAAGSYTYYVETAYTDFSGTSHKLTSNHATVTVSAPQTEEAAEQLGYIIGHVVCDKNTPTSGIKINFSDGSTAHGPYFMRNKIPVGKSLTLTVEGDETHDYESVAVVVKAGENFVTINGTMRAEYQPNNLASDLAICSPLEVTLENGQHHARFKIRNLSSIFKWKGFLEFEAVKTNHLGIYYNLTGNKPTYHRHSEGITIEAGGELEINVALKDIDLDDDTNFDLYIKSKGKWVRDGFDDENTSKGIAIADGSGTTGFPIAATFAKNPKRDWDKKAKEDFAYMMLGLSSLTPGMDGMVGNLAPYKAKTISLTNAKSALSDIIEWLGGKTALEAINDPTLYNISSAMKGVYDDVKGTIKPPLVQRFLKSIVKKVSDETTANLMINDLMLGEISDLATAVTSKSAFDQSIACASMLYRLAAGSNTVPLASMMHSYMVVGQSLIDAVKQYGTILNGRYIVGRLMANKPYTGSGNANGERVNTAADFKLIINSKSSPINFTKKNAQEQIKSIYIKAALREGLEPAVFSFKPIYKKDCIMLQSDGNGYTGKYVDPQNEIKVLYMEINFANDRQALIPLIKETDGITFTPSSAPQLSDGFDKATPVVYTVTLTTNTGKDNIADELYLGSNENRE